MLMDAPRFPAPSVTPVDPHRWNRLSAHFHRLVDVSVAERELLLEDVEAELREELRELLAAHDGDDEALATSAPQLADLIEDEALEDDLVGTTLGSRHVGERVGVGGMGVVYLAEDVRAGVTRRVAIKVIKRGMDSEHVVARFRAEQSILASLDHESIARLLDVGVVSDGRPYLVMEYVDGVPIDAWCRDHDLPIAARLRLFRAVCDAVHHAHRALVVHRDLKPSNILVTPEGRVKLLDFGIAKLLDPDPERSPRTLTGLVPMTPQYASPEQARGDVVTTAVDVYGLGVLLYLLLTDRHPIRTESRTPEQVLDAVTAARVERPSQAAPRRSRRLRGDLDRIVHVAMHPDPEQRYASALALSDDVGRHLHGHPVRAHGDSVAYRCGKFVRRHRASVVASSIAVVSLLAFAVVSGVQTQRIARQSDQIRAERDRAEQVQALVVDMFDVSDPLGDRSVQADTLRVRDFLRLNQDTMLDRLEGQPDVQARFAHLLARLHVNLGRYDDAAPLIERSVALRRELHDDHPELARGLDFQGTVKQHLGDFEQAEAAFREALAMRRRLYGEMHREVAESLNNLSVILDATARIDSSLVLDEAALAIRREVLGPRDPETVQSLNNLGVAYLQQERPEVAEPLLREALAARRELLGPRHPRVANTLNNLARTLMDLDRDDEAESMLREAIDVWGASLGPDHPRIGGGYYNLAFVLDRAGRPDEAIEAMRRSHAIDRASYPGDHPYVASSALELGRMLLDRTRTREAVEFLELADRIHTGRYGAEDEQTREVRALLARALAAEDAP